MTFPARRTIVTAATVALTALPGAAVAAAHGPATAPGQTGVHKTPGHGKPYKTTPPTTGSPTKAYGKYCRAESKQHVKGQKGTPFSQCVTALAHLSSGTATNPTTACKTLSKQHVRGHKRTPFSACVSAGAKLQKAAS